MKPAILINNYNNAPFLDRCIRSTAAQSYLNPYDVVIYDDGSSDGSQDIIREYADKYAFITAILAPRGQNTGAINQTMAVLKAFEHSDADVFFILDGDDSFTGDKLSTVMPYFKEGVSMVQHPAMRTDGEIYPEILKVASVRSFMLKWHCIDWLFSVSSCLAVKREVLEYMDIEKEKNYDKLYIDSRVARLAPFFGEVVTIPDTLTRYYYDPTKDTKTKQYRKSSEQQRREYIKDYTGETLSRLQYRIRKPFCLPLVKASLNIAQ